MLRFILTGLGLFFIVGQLFADKIMHEKVPVPGTENPHGIAISPDGLRMVMVDYPSKGLPVVKETVRPYLAAAWTFADPILTINRKITKETKINGFCFSFDGTKLFFAANIEGTLGGTDVFYCERKNDAWSEPVNLGTPVNSTLDENFPSLSGNNREFYFTRKVDVKKLDDFNCGEIWMSRLDSTSAYWLEPEKLNTEINSGGIAYPKVYDDNRTIFYSRIVDDKQKWDIYWVKRFGDNHWYLPVLLDSLASKESEISPFYCKADNKLYFVMNEGSDSKPKTTIYRITSQARFIPDKTIKIGGTVMDVLQGKPLSANLLVTDPVFGKIRFFCKSNPDNGLWEMLLNSDYDYLFHVWVPGYSHQYQMFPVENNQKDQRVNFALFPETEWIVNIYDKEELRALAANLTISEKNGKQIPLKPVEVAAGQQKFNLAIGRDYLLRAEVKDFVPNTIELGLSTTVLYNKFVRDIELEPLKRDIEFYVQGNDDHQPLEATIELLDERRGITLMPETVIGTTGRYRITLREGDKFGVNIRGPKGYAFYHTDIDLDSDRALKRVEVELNKLKKKVAIRLNNINFEFNSADLIESSYEELNRVVQLMKDNPDIRVEIMAHTDDVGSDAYNDKLSNKRAQSVMNYLIVSGIPDFRLFSKGYGEKVPLVPNTNDENRALNRRVEMKILDLIEVDASEENLGK